MSNSGAQPNAAVRDFAVDVVKTLRQAGYEALWAGGCVRDSLLQRIPVDYDVASSATPEEVIRLFGPRRTVPVGASFGVVMVLGPNRASGQVEVATFRTDGRYLDGRRPSSVQFCTPQEDAQRRDFTINGMFLDPLNGNVIDYVGGREDLAAGMIRAIGNPADRFAEDKLRMLRAVRFAATFGFELEADTCTAIQQQAHDLRQVSVERIAQELRRMLSHFSRERSLALLKETQLLSVLFPQIYGADALAETGEAAKRFTRCYLTLKHLSCSSFEPALCALLLPLWQDGETHRKRIAVVRTQCELLKLSGQETELISWLADSVNGLAGAERQPLHRLKPLLAHPEVSSLLQLSEADAAATGRTAVDAAFCRRYLAQHSKDHLNPEPLVNGQDLKQLGVPAGPGFGRMLELVRQEQLDERLLTRDQALLRLQQLVQSGSLVDDGHGQPQPWPQ
jgi:tRNA nucleotidyltransferase/poly(A) polymerase